MIKVNALHYTSLLRPSAFLYKYSARSWLTILPGLIESLLPASISLTANEIQRLTRPLQMAEGFVRGEYLPLPAETARDEANLSRMTNDPLQTTASCWRAERGSHLPHTQIPNSMAAPRAVCPGPIRIVSGVSQRT